MLAVHKPQALKIARFRFHGKRTEVRHQKLPFLSQLAASSVQERQAGLNKHQWRTRKSTRFDCAVARSFIWIKYDYEEYSNTVLQNLKS